MFHHEGTDAMWKHSILLLLKKLIYSIIGFGVKYKSHNLPQPKEQEART